MTVADPAQLPLLSAAGDPAGSVAVPAVFDGAPHDHALYLAVTAQLANARTGTHSTKSRGEVSGGGKKPWKQKHTGRARQGSTRAPQWPGGGIAFGPRPHRHEKDLPAAVRRLALRSAVAAKIREGRVTVVESVSLEAPKTKLAAAWLSKVGAAGMTVVVVPAASELLARAFRNLPSTRVTPAKDVSTYDLLRAGRIVVSKDALDALARRAAAEAPHAT